MTMLENGLRLNPSQTEAVVSRTVSKLRSVDISGSVKVAGTSLQFSAQPDFPWIGMYPASSVLITKFVSFATSVRD